MDLFLGTYNAIFTRVVNELLFWAFTLCSYCDPTTNLWSCCRIIPVLRIGTEAPRISVTLSKLDSGRSRSEIQTQVAPESNSTYVPMLRILLPILGGPRCPHLWVAVAMDFGLQVKDSEFETCLASSMSSIILLWLHQNPCNQLNSQRTRSVKSHSWVTYLPPHPLLAHLSQSLAAACYLLKCRLTQIHFLCYCFKI